MQMQDVINKLTEAGNNWFDKQTMRFWDSRIESELFDNLTFILSELTHDGKERRYTIRQYVPDCNDIKTAGEFLQYETLEDAVSEAKKVRFDYE